MSKDSGQPKIGELSDELFVLKEVTWKIPKHVIRPSFFDHNIQSPSFSFADATWVLHLYPYGRIVSDSAGYIQLEIERLDSHIPQHCVGYKSYFKTFRGKEFIPNRVSHTFDANVKIGWLLYIEKENFVIDEEIITTGDVLTFICQMRTPRVNGIEVFSQTDLAVPVVKSSKETSGENLESHVSISQESSEKISEKKPDLPMLISQESSEKTHGKSSESPTLISQEPSQKASGNQPESPPPIIQESPEKALEKKPESPTSINQGCGCSSRHTVGIDDRKMLRDFRELFLKKEDCDVIINVNGQEFPAHRNILRARSPVFASTFRVDMKEKATGIVDIVDCDPTSFTDFLCFLYCGSVENLTTENIFSLFTAADKYDVQDLRSECLEFMKRNLSVDTFCETVTLSLRHFESELIELTADFFAKNLHEIIVTPEWQSFLVRNPIQGNEILIKAFGCNKK